jgi:uncharacterized repeat protein (TIGR03803 family)
MKAFRLLALTAALGASLHFSLAQDSGPHLTTIYDSGSYGSLVFGANGDLYGNGAELTPPASPGGVWTVTMLPNAGGFAGPVIGKNGTLYGTTEDTPSTVYDLVPPASPGGAWTANTLYSFPESDGYLFFAGVAMGKDGTLYGASNLGGGNPTGCYASLGCGALFEVAPPSAPGGAWMAAVLHNFTGGSDGGSPSASPIIGPKGELYGTTWYGGTSNLGTVYELTPPASPGGAWTETVLHAFTGLNGDGASPWAGLVIGKNGQLYGTTVAGGTSNNGTVFELTPPASPGGAWLETVLYSFAGGSDGAYPQADVVIGKDGVLYGTTLEGGTPCGCGTVFALKPPASQGAAWTERVLYSFTDSSDGGYPWASLVIGKNGALYGTTSTSGPSGYGTWFQLTP